MDNIASIIDHTLLDPAAPLGRFTDLVREAKAYSFHSVCVSSAMVPLVSHLLFSDPKNTVALCSTIGFPHGNVLIDAKLVEMNWGMKFGVTEFDVVAPIYAIKSQDWDHFGKEIVQLREASKGYILKIILETGLLEDSEMLTAGLICVANGVDFLKTSTGYNIKLEPSKTADNVAFLKRIAAGSPTKVKASGGIKTLADLELMIQAGAERIGTSNGIKIVDEWYKTKGDKI